MAQLTTELTTDFRRGMVDNTAGTRFPPDAVASLINGTFEADATISRRYGSARLHATALNSGGLGYGATRFVTAAGVEQMIVIAGDTAYSSTDYGATYSQIATGLRQDYYDFATMRVGASNYLFAANGDTTIKRWDGTTWDTAANAPSGVKYIATFNGRLWVTGHSGVLLQASKIADPTTWSSPDGLTVQILVASGGTPTGIFQVGPHLLVFDEEQTSYVDGYGEQTIIVATGATGISRSVGCVAFRSIVGVGDTGCCWLSKRGIEYYKPGYAPELLSRAITQALASTDRAELLSAPGRACAVYDETEELYRLALSTTGTRNNITFKISLRQRSQSYFGAASIDRPVSATGDLLFDGDSSGYLVEVSSSGGGYQFGADPDGYVELAYSGFGADPTAEDGDGYLDTVTDDSMPASMFMAPTATHPGYVHSVGYDGFVRLHSTQDKDDILSDGTGGSDIDMTIVSRPFYFGSPRIRKKVRVAHLSGICDEPRTVRVAVRAGGERTAYQSVTVAAGGFDQSTRSRTMISAKGDAPQLEITSSEEVRITMLGLSASGLKERV